MQKPNEILRRMQKKRYCYLFLLPFFSFFFLFTVVPVLAAMGLSTTYFNILEAPKFVGADNYIRLGVL